MNKLVLLLFLMMTVASAQAYVPDVGEGQCVAFCDDSGSSSSSSSSVYQSTWGWEGWNPNSSSSSSSSSSRSYSGPSRAEIAQQNRLNQAYKDNEQANAYYKNDQYDLAIEFYRKALDNSPNDSVIQKNLRRAEAGKHNEAGIKHLDNLEYQEAVDAFDKASKLKPESETIRNNLVIAEDRLNHWKEYKVKEKLGNEAAIRAGNAMRDVTASLSSDQAPLTAVKAGGSTDGLQFMSASEMHSPVHEKMKTLKIKEVPEPALPVPQWDPLSAKSRAEIVLDAIQAGGRNWDNSVGYLKNYLATKNPNNVKVQEALSYVQGMRDGSRKYGNGLDFQDASGQSAGLNTQMVAGNASASKWPGPTRADGQLANPLSFETQRDEVVSEVLKENGGDYEAAISQLEKEIGGSDTAFTRKDAVAYLRGMKAQQDHYTRSGTTRNP